MTVCQYFLQGRCRYGQNCRFEHSYNNDDRNSQNILNSQQLSTIVKKVAEAVILAEKGGQWPLSCFSPLKEGTNVPGWEDYSPEEIRWKMYEARANGTLHQVTREINQLYVNAEKLRNALKEPTLERLNIIENLIKGRSETTSLSNPFKSSTSNIFGGSSSSAQNIFGTSSISSSQGSIFGGAANTTGNKGNIFGGSNTSTGNVFGNATCFSNNSVYGNPVSSNVFAQSSLTNSQNIGGSGNIFGGSTTSSQNIFSKTEGVNQNAFLSQNSSGIFSTSNSVFDSKKVGNDSRNQSLNIFSSHNNSIFTTLNTFGKTDIFGTQQQPAKSAFGGGTHVSVEYDISIYSKVEDLNEEEVKSFTSPTFSFGKIPLKPPPQNYCK